jgi:alanine-synthesizing transaminase
MFSSRLPSSLAPNALTQAAQALRARGVAWIDLTETNPTAVGLEYPTDVLLALAHPNARRYTPEARGLRVAREAIAGDYARRGRQVSADRVVVTASTSEAYSILFKLLCDPGDAVLVPQPSYPLFDLLARLEAVALRPYRLVDHDGWSIDRQTVLDALQAMTSAVRAVLVVSPNNPTGSILRRADADWLAAECARRDVALIVDEVFADYPLAARSAADRPIPDDPLADSSLTSPNAPCLTFSLGGLSKSAGLPQLKLGWIAAGGPDALVGQSLERLDVICDTYLSVSTLVQAAAPAFIEAGAGIRSAIQARVRRNLEALRETLRARPEMTLLEPDAGWSAVWRIPAIESEEALVLRLLTESHVLVHPGYFFDFAREAFLVTSLLPQPQAFDDGIGRVMAGIRPSR